MPRLLIPSGELTGHLLQGAEERVLANLSGQELKDRRIILEAVTIRYRLEEEVPRIARELIPNIDPVRGYDSGQHPELAAPNGEDAHPHDDATGHIERTHEDFGPRLEKSHITDLPSWGKVGC